MPPEGADGADVATSVDELELMDVPVAGARPAPVIPIFACIVKILADKDYAALHKPLQRNGLPKNVNSAKQDEKLIPLRRRQLKMIV